MRFRFQSLLSLALLIATPLRAAEITATGISLSFFDASGRPSHKLIAQRGTTKGSRQTLTGVELVYFSATEPDQVIRRLQAEEAVWEPGKETLTGNGSLIVITEQHRLTGEGFDFSLVTSRLLIQRAFTLENSEIRLTSDRATVDLHLEKGGGGVRVSDVRRCEAAGNLTIAVLPTARKKYPCETAYSELAIYDGVAQTIELPKPTRTVSQGRESTVGHFLYDLRDALKKPE